MDKWFNNFNYYTQWLRNGSVIPFFVVILSVIDSSFLSSLGSFANNK